MFRKLEFDTIYYAYLNESPFKYYCHTRSNLGISAWLEILQTCKLDHNVAVKCTWEHPPTHRYQNLSYFYESSKSKIFWVSCGCFEFFWSLFEGSVEGVWNVSVRYLKGVWRLLGGCLEGVWRVSGRCLIGQ